VLIWGVIGNFIAGLLPTAGPALYGLATGDATRFTHLQAFLGSTPNTTAATQHYLWQAHEQGASVLGAGISAFPSMHVAVACMCALFVAELGGVWRFVALGYTLLIMASSVYLGWHYAIDGYAAVLLTTAIYWGVGKAVPWLERLRLRGPALQPVGAAAKTSR
jgi:membrane-associated phospholipid phosphatase